MIDWLAYFNSQTEHMVEHLGQLVRLESPTSSKGFVDKLGAKLVETCRDLGAAVTVHRREEVGDIVLAEWNGNTSGKPILLVTHMDTVWPVGTLDTMPLRRDDERLYGPGALDMKAGLVIALTALRGLIENNNLPSRPIWLFINSDEETGSFHSRDLLYEMAQQAGLALVFEPAAEGEAFKTWRKGIGRYVVHTSGVASHAGNAPEAGVNAVIEAAHQALAVHTLNDLKNGTSVSVTMIKGGITSNVIPPDASFEVDVRFLKASEAERIDTAIRSLTPVLPGAGVRVEGGIDRGPMERDAQMIRALQQAQAVGRSLGMELSEAGSGGASDGNFTAAMGIPTLDGLGAEGAGLHAHHEQLVVRSLPRRAALVAKILLDWDMDAV
ncbi:MAG: M20 family metallopeptidase [Anaerolineae bacterium]|nr:M20 family metallopeptidase [Anaerolineae bacterium]